MLLYYRYKPNIIIISLGLFRLSHYKHRPPSQGPRTGELWTHLGRGSGPHRTNTHTHTQTNTRERMKEWMRARKMSERDRERYTNTSFDSAQMCLPSTRCGGFQSAFNPIIKLVMLPWTHRPLAGECAHAGLTNSNYVWGLLTLCEHF